MSEPTTLLLVRHGTTDANVRVPYILQGSGMDLPLNDNGQRQAEQVAEFLASFPIQRVYASPLLRAVQTAESISVRHSLHVQTVSEIVECNVGVWEGKNWDTIAGEHPKEYVEFHRDPGINPYLGGESYADVQPGEKLALFNSAGYLEIAINKGNAAGLFGLKGFSEKASKAEGILQNQLFYQTVRVYFE